MTLDMLPVRMHIYTHETNKEVLSYGQVLPLRRKSGENLLVLGSD